MKQTWERCRLQVAGGRLPAKLAGSILALALPAAALTSDNPYAAIVTRNAFALNPPAPVTNAPAGPVIPPSDIEFRGLSTLLGRPQALINVKSKPKPPETPKDRSLVMDIGQREGEVELLEINMGEGSVKLRNQGNVVTLNLKDNSPKPQAAAGLPTVAPAAGMPGGVPVPSLGRPALPTPGGVPAPASMPGINPGGATPAGPATLPVRDLRASGNTATPNAPNAGWAANQVGSPPTIDKLTANAALYEANRAKNEELIKQGARIPRMPIHSLLKQEQGQPTGP
jgi:hypothetical protein